MNERKNLMSKPERFYTLDNNMSIDKIIQAQSTGEPLVGEVVLWNAKAKCLKVNLGNKYFGYLSIENASIYPTLTPDGKLTASIRALIGKPVVVSVAEVTSDNEIFLSRKNLMLEAFDTLPSLIGETIECCVTSISSFGIFVDVGNGLTGLIHCTDLCLSRFDNFSDFGINIGDKITAKILSIDDKFHINLNYKDLFKNLAFVLEENDLIIATILKQLNQDGYFAYVNPNTSALINVPPEISVNYGDKVLARVKRSKPAHPEKLNLTFVSFSK